MIWLALFFLIIGIVAVVGGGYSFIVVENPAVSFTLIIGGAVLVLLGWWLGQD
jgi:hypothetical protein